jgi:two-component system, sensor histidine kinase
MMTPVPANEQERLAALYAYELLDTEPEQAFRDLVSLAAQICQTPMAAISLIDRDRLWFKAKVGIEQEQTSRDAAFSSYAILGSEIMTVSDASLDERFVANPLVNSAPSVRFYAGVPLLTPEGYALGTLAVLDYVPRTLTPEQQAALGKLTDQVMGRIELRRQLREAKQSAEELKQALVKADEAFRLKSKFVAGMSHEIRTPLNGVIGMTGLLLDAQLSPARRELAQIARTSAESLLVLINDILDLARIEAGELTVEATPFDLHAVVNEAAEILFVGAQAKGLQLSIHYAPDAPRLLIGDAERIRQILVNLAGNAVKFTSVGQVSIQVDCLHQTTDGAQVRVSVQDTGIGIAPEQLTHLFDPFTQAATATSRRYGGTGLGLAICHRLAQLMNAPLEVQSALGKGSTFSLTLDLPIASDAVTVPESKEDDFAGPITAVIHVGPIRLLVVEDNAINQRVTQLMLEKQGRHIDLAANGIEALRMLEQTTYDLILMDCRMPEMDGFEATRRIRERERGGPRTPIIALTASALEGDRQQCLAAGMDDFLAKPVQRDDIEHMLARYLSQTAPLPNTVPLPAPEAPMGEPPFDLSVLTDRIGNNPEVLREFARLFLDETSRLLAACHQAVQQRDGTALSGHAHALRGILMNLETGRDTVQAIALTRLLEQRGQVEGLRGTGHLLTTVEARLTRIATYLRASVLAEPAPPLTNRTPAK